MSPMLRAVAAVAVAATVVVGVAAIAVRRVDPVSLASPSPTVAPDPTRTPADEPTGTPAADDLAILAAIEAAVEELRGLPPAGIGPPEVIGRDQLVAELERLFEEEYPPDEREADNFTLRAMGLLDPDEDVAELQLSLLGEQVLGFYDDTEQRMVVVSDAGVNVEARFTYAHEYTHALQDAAFGLDGLDIDTPDEDDLGLAHTALVEGDATLATLAWALQGGLTQAELMDLATIDIPDTAGVPDWMVAILEFPYVAGTEWVLQLAGGNPLAPDFDAVDEAFADPPVSTEQILHVDKWLAREEPIEVAAPDLAGALGDGWDEVATTTVGEAWIRINLEFFGVGATDAAAAAAGWGGDRLVVAGAADDAFAMAWILAWDTPADADEFVDAYTDAIAALSFSAEVVTLADGRVLVAHASSPEILAATVTAAGG